MTQVYLISRIDAVFQTDETEPLSVHTEYEAAKKEVNDRLNQDQEMQIDHYEYKIRVMDLIREPTEMQMRLNLL